VHFDDLIRAAQVSFARYRRPQNPPPANPPPPPPKRSAKPPPPLNLARRSATESILSTAPARSALSEAVEFVLALAARLLFPIGPRGIASRALPIRPTLTAPPSSLRT